MLLFVDKPSGFTSYDLIRKLKRIYPGEKIGHAGTLDPLATGLMIIAIGRDTKRLSSFVGLDKTYLATIDFAKRSDTRDIDYREEFAELDPVELTVPSREQLEAELERIRGVHPLPLTPFSAKKWKGKKLYEYARVGQPVYIDVDMELIDYEILQYEFPELVVKLHVGSGTYIRSIAHWL